MSDCTTSTKHCKKCNRDLPATSEFWHTRRASKDGLAYICKECAIAKTNEWYAADPDRARLLAKESHNRHKAERKVYEAKRKDKQRARKQTSEYKTKESERRKRNAAELREYNRKYKAEHPGWVKKVSNEWRKANPERVKATMHKRLARKHNAPGTYTAADVKRVYFEQEGHCGYCGIGIFMDIPKDVHVDHIVPLSRGGSNEPDNLLLTCSSCNQSKGAKLLTEWKSN